MFNILIWYRSFKNVFRKVPRQSTENSARPSGNCFSKYLKMKKYFQMKRKYQENILHKQKLNEINREK